VDRPLCPCCDTHEAGSNLPTRIRPERTRKPLKMYDGLPRDARRRCKPEPSLPSRQQTLPTQKHSALLHAAQARGVSSEMERQLDCSTSGPTDRKSCSGQHVQSSEQVVKLSCPRMLPYDVLMPHHYGLLFHGRAPPRKGTASPSFHHEHNQSQSQCLKIRLSARICPQRQHRPFQCR